MLTQYDIFYQNLDKQTFFYPYTLSQEYHMLIDHHMMENNPFSEAVQQNQKVQIETHQSPHHPVLRLDYSSNEDYVNTQEIPLPQSTAVQESQYWSYQRKQSRLVLYNDKFNNLPFKELSGFSTRNIISLFLSYRPIYRKGIRQIVKCNFSSIRQISLHHTLLDDEGTAELAKGSWPQLQKLELDHNYISDRGHTYLSTAYWPSMRKLQVSIDKSSLNVLRALLRTEYSKKKGRDAVQIELDSEENHDIIYCFKYFEIGFFVENKSVYCY